MSHRLHPIPTGAGVLLVPDYFVTPTPDERVVRPARRRRRGDRNA